MKTPPSFSRWNVRSISAGRAFLLSAAAGFLMSGTMNGQIIVDSAAWTYENGVLTDQDTQSSGTTSYANSSGPDGYASAYSNTNGVLNVSAKTNTNVAALMSFSFPAPSGEATFSSLARWEGTILNNTGQVIDYRYIFHVDNPRIGITGAGDYAGLSLDILLNGNSVWSAFMEMDQTGLSYSPNLAAPTISGDNAYFATFDAAADLGTFTPGQQFTVTYELRAYATTANGENQVYAAVGDPAYPAGEPLQVIAQVVPEPGAFLLLGAGFTGFVFRRRKNA